MEHLPDESTVYHTGDAASPDRPPAGSGQPDTEPAVEPAEPAEPAVEPDRPASAGHPPAPPPRSTPAPGRSAAAPDRPAGAPAERSPAPGRPTASPGQPPEGAAPGAGRPRAGTGRSAGQGTGWLTPVFTAAPPPDDAAEADAGAREAADAGAREAAPFDAAPGGAPDLGAGAPAAERPGRPGPLWAVHRPPRVGLDQPGGAPLHRLPGESLRPRAFALVDEVGVRAYGLSLPDGTALTVQWTAEGSGALGMWSAPQAPARLWVCELIWLDEAQRPG